MRKMPVGAASSAVIAFAVFALAGLLLSACKPAPPPIKEYAYPAWGFRASFPSAPVESSKPGSADGSTPNADLVEANDGHHDFAVWAADVSKTSASLDDLASSAAQHVSEASGSTAGIPTYAATSEGATGREYQLSQGGKWYATMDVYLVGGRFYEVIGRSALGKDDPAVKSFLISFHTHGAAPAANSAF